MGERGRREVGAGQTVGWLSLANLRRMYVIILAPELEVVGETGQEMEGGHLWLLPFAFADLPELIYSSEECLLTVSILFWID